MKPDSIDALLAFVFVAMRPGRDDAAFLKAMKKQEAVLECHTVTGAWCYLLKLRLPSALPSLMASAKVCAPLAILGSILNGWLSTGTGLGALMVNSTITAQYAQLWAAVVVVTVASIVFAALVSVVEQPVLARFAPDRLAA